MTLYVDVMCDVEHVMVWRYFIHNWSLSLSYASSPTPFVQTPPLILCYFLDLVIPERVSNYSIVTI